MKANELMIGDWVQHQEGKCEVLSIHIDGITFWDKKGGGAVSLDRISPIPLTAEIIKKNGFVNDFYEEECVADYHFIRHDGYSFNTKIAHITWCNGNVIISTDFDGKVSKEIQFVHELQHALRLCGIDKEIVL